VEDAARAALLAMENVQGPVNIGSGNVYTIREMVEALTKVSSMEGRVDWDRSKPNGREYLGYDLSKIHATGFKSENTLEAGLRKTWDWYVAQEAVS